MKTGGVSFHGVIVLLVTSDLADPSTRMINLSKRLVGFVPTSTSYVYFETVLFCVVLRYLVAVKSSSNN